MLINRSDINKISGALKKENKKIVFTNGCFDILHAGHVKYLEQAATFGDILIVGINSDASVRRLKGDSRPINMVSDRAIVLSALKCVDFTVIFDEDTPYELVKQIRPNVIVKGGDYSPETIIGADIVVQDGGEVIVIPLLEGRSTSSIIEKLRN